MSDNIFGGSLFTLPGTFDVKPLDVEVPTIETVTPVTPVDTVAATPAVAVAPDRELDSALTDLALAGRVLNNISNSIEVVLTRLTDKKNDVEPAVVTDVESTVTPSTETLSVRERAILTLLRNNTNQVVTTSQIKRVVGGGSLSAAVSRIRKCGFTIESTQTIRNNGERVAKNLTGYRYSTAAQASKRNKAIRARSEIKSFLTSLITEAFGV